jgi:hypothetical protein
MIARMQTRDDVPLVDAACSVFLRLGRDQRTHMVFGNLDRAPQSRLVEDCTPRLKALGHTVRLMSPAYVKPYVKRQKNDAADAEAICEAVTRANMRLSRPRVSSSRVA